MGVEDVDDLGEIGKRPRQPVDLIDNDDLPAPSATSVRASSSGSTLKHVAS
jgi:hypothetical protein